MSQDLEDCTVDSAGIFFHVSNRSLLQNGKRSRKESKQHRPFVALANLTRVRSGGRGRIPTLKALLLYWKPHILENPLLAPKKENEMYIRVVAKADIYESSIKSAAIFKNPELWYDWKYRHAVKHMYSNVRATFNSLPSPLKVRDVPLA